MQTGDSGTIDTVFHAKTGDSGTITGDSGTIGPAKCTGEYSLDGLTT